MFPDAYIRSSFALPKAAILLLFIFTHASAQSTVTLQGLVVDLAGAVLPAIKITVCNEATGIERVSETDDGGNYLVAALPVGVYRVEVRAAGFRTVVVERLNVEVGRIAVQDFQLEVGDITQMVNGTSDASFVEQAGISVGQVIDRCTVQTIRLNAFVEAL